MSVRRLAAIVVFDVVEYSRMMAEDEDGTHSALKAHRIEMDPILLNHGGRIVKGTGDGLLLEVPSAVEAVKASIEVQRLMTERNAVLPEARRMQFRVGINLGDIIAEDDGDIYGDGVNVAARLEGLAKPGGICVSGSIHDQVVGRVDCSFADLGRVEVKNIPQPVHAFHVVRDDEEPVKTAATSSYATPSVAVFPFSNLSDDPEQDYFADGITEDLITALSHYHDIRVSSRSSVFSIGGRNLDTRDAARELDATYVVDGSVRKAGERVRITAQLVEAETGHHVWADKFDRELDDIFQVQDEIVFEIAGHIHPSLERREVGKLKAASPEELDVWDLLLRARKEEFRGTIDGSREAIRLLEIARERDPTSATTHAYLAGAWTSVAFNRWSIDDRKPFQELFRSAAEASRLDPTDPIALTMLAMAENYAGHHESAETLSQRALSLAPHDALTLNSVGQVRLFRGDTDAAVEPLSAAWRLAEHEPWRHHIATNLAFAHYLAGRYEAAWAWTRRGLEASEYLQLRAIGAAALAQLGRAEDADRQMSHVTESWPLASTSLLLRNVQWEHEEDIEHYRQGLEKAGLPT
jgi:adenylate cyclase